MKNPTKEQVKKLRISKRLTWKEAAKIADVNWRTWARWESGESNMNNSKYELFLIKTKS